MTLTWNDTGLPIGQWDVLMSNKQRDKSFDAEDQEFLQLWVEFDIDAGARPDHQRSIERQELYNEFLGP